MTNTDSVKAEGELFSNQSTKELVCPQKGVWVDLAQAKEILSLNLSGQFYYLTQDNDFPSGYKMCTSHNGNPCSFLANNSSCRIEQANHQLKPAYCRGFFAKEKNAS